MSEVSRGKCKVCGAELQKLPYHWENGKRVIIGEPGIWQCKEHGYGD